MNIMAVAAKELERLEQEKVEAAIKAYLLDIAKELDD